MSDKDFQKLQSDILMSLSPDSPNSTGFRSCYCPVCGKTSRKTAGVMIENDAIAYNCFRASCSATCVYTYGEPVSRKFKDLCRILAIKIPPSLSMVKNSFQKKLESLDESLYAKHIYKDMKVPEGWTSLEGTVKEEWKTYYRNRKIPLDNILYIKKGLYKGLTAITLKYYEKTIGFQIVDPDGMVKYRHYSDNDHTIAINSGYVDSPCILVEGVADAMCFPNAVGTMKNKIDPEQAYALRGRDVIMLPDKSGGEQFIKQAKTYGWKICIPPWTEKDLNAAVIRYGIMVVARMIMENTYTNYKKANVAYQQWRDHVNK